MPEYKKQAEAERLFAKCLESPFLHEISTLKEAQILHKNKRKLQSDIPYENQNKPDQWVGLVCFRDRLRGRLTNNTYMYTFNATYGDRYLHELMGQHIGDLDTNNWVSTNKVVKALCACSKQTNSSNKPQITTPSAGTDEKKNEDQLE